MIRRLEQFSGVILIFVIWEVLIIAIDSKGTPVHVALDIFSSLSIAVFVTRSIWRDRIR
jgi:hypothetical protein